MVVMQCNIAEIIELVYNQAVEAAAAVIVVITRKTERQTDRDAKRDRERRGGIIWTKM